MAIYRDNYATDNYTSTEYYELNVSPDYHSLTTTYGSGGFGNGAYIKENERPNFKALFEDYKLHHPEQHRIYAWNLSLADDYNYDYYHKQLQTFDRTKIELKTLHKDDNKYITVSTETVNYLKQNDEKFVQSMASLLDAKQRFTSAYHEVYPYRKEDYEAKIQNVQNLIDDTNNKFSSFVAEFSRSLMDLQKPFLFDDGVGGLYPSSVGNVSAIEAYQAVHSLFGSVAPIDEYVSAYNEEEYDSKEETDCCLVYLSNKDYFRQKGVPYSQSEQKIKDMEELEKYKQSDEFFSYVPPKPYERITLADYASNLYKQGNQIVNSPINYLFNQLRPFFDGLVSDGTIDAYKIRGNSLNVKLTLNLFN